MFTMYGRTEVELTGIKLKMVKWIWVIRKPYKIAVQGSRVVGNM